MSKLLRLSLRCGLERKLFPAMSALGCGNSAARRAARGSIVPPGKMLVGRPEPFMGTPQKPFALRLETCVKRVLKISPTKVGWLLQSTAIEFGIGFPLSG